LVAAIVAGSAVCGLPARAEVDRNPNAMASPAFRTTDLAIVTGKGRFPFRVELADTPETQARGLMYRTSLPADRGMLFVFAEPRPVAMWMKNTFVPLDMIFLDGAGRVVDVAERTEPLSTAIIQSRAPARAVLEVSGGTARRIGLGIGDIVEHPAFRQRSPSPRTAPPR
jgi:hypothetical protein